MRRLLLSLCVIVAAAAQAATPDAGSILQQAQPVTPQAPLPDTTGLSIERAETGNLPPSVAFDVTSIRIDGNTLFATADLHVLIAGAEGKSLTLAQLNQFAERITNFYHEHGFFLARAYIPMQTIENGVVRFDVLEARYGKISLDNQSKVNAKLLAATLAPLKADQPIRQAEMDKSLLLLSDIPGTVVHAILKPGEVVGSSDLKVEAKPGAAYRGEVALDNFGNRFSGRFRLGATLNYFNPFAHGDVLSASLLSGGNNMTFGRASYETLLNGSGTRAGAAYSSVNYTLGDTLAALNAHGVANVGSLWARHPVVRGTNRNLNVQFQYDRKNLDDRVGIVSTTAQRRLGNRIFTIAGDVRDNFLSGSVSTWNLGYTSGEVVFEDASAQQADAASAKTAGSFSKWTLGLTRLQALGKSDALYINVFSQWARSNLDSAEKMVAGGVYSVRAYDMGAVSGDSGCSALVELRHDLGNNAQGQWQGLAFVDVAHLVINRNPWTAGTNSATLTGVGAGLNWTGPKQLSARATIATRLGAKPELVTDTSVTRAWIVVTRSF